MTRRSGMSLTEVLVALFIMALGTIAILTLFPLGALNMAQALKDDRTSQAATQADAFMRMYWKQNLGEPLQFAIGTSPVSNGSALDLNLATGFVNPSGTAQNVEGALLGIPPGNTTAGQPNLLPLNLTDVGTGSYAVVIDPMGFLARSPGSLDQTWIATRNSTSLLRLNLNLPGLNPLLSTTAATQAFRNCSLMDGLGYSTNGAALLNASSGTIDRETRYNWLWILQQQNIGLTSVNNQNVISTSTPVLMTVVVFDKRANGFVPSNAEQVFTPSACQVGSNLVSFNSSVGSVPIVQKGDWLMDATVAHLDCNLNVYNPPAPPPVAVSPPPPAVPATLSTPISYVRNANFYRIVSVTQNGTSTDIELQTPIPADTCTTSVQQILPRQTTVSSFSPNVTIQPSNRQFVLLTGVTEVFQRPVLTFP